MQFKQKVNNITAIEKSFARDCRTVSQNLLLNKKYKTFLARIKCKYCAANINYKESLLAMANSYSKLVIIKCVKTALSNNAKK